MASYCSLPLFLYLCIVEERLLSLVLHKGFIYILKIIPMLLTITSMLNTFLSYFKIDIPLLSYLGGVSLFPLLFLYIASYAFKFCEYHRVFLHYVLVNWLLNIVDYYWGIPVSDKGMFLLYMIIVCLFLFMLLYFHQKEVKKRRSEIKSNQLH